MERAVDRSPAQKGGGGGGGGGRGSSSSSKGPLPPPPPFLPIIPFSPWARHHVYPCRASINPLSPPLLEGLRIIFDSGGGGSLAPSGRVVYSLHCLVYSHVFVCMCHFPPLEAPRPTGGPPTFFDPLTVPPLPFFLQLHALLEGLRTIFDSAEVGPDGRLLPGPHLDFRVHIHYDKAQEAGGRRRGGGGPQPAAPPSGERKPIAVSYW